MKHLKKGTDPLTLMLIKFGLIIFFSFLLLSCSNKRVALSEDNLYHWVTQDRCFINEKVNQDVLVSRDDLILYYYNYWYRFTFEQFDILNNFEKIKIKSIIGNKLIFMDSHKKYQEVQGMKLTKQINSDDLIYCNSDLQKELLLIKELTFSELDMSNLDMTNIIVSILKREMSAFDKYPYRIISILVDTKQYLNLVSEQLKTDFNGSECEFFIRILQTKNNDKYLKVKVKANCGVRCGGIKEYTLKRTDNKRWKVIHIQNLINY